MKLLRKILVVSGLMSGLFTASIGVSHAITINQYTNFTDWSNAVGAYVTEDFNDNVLASPLQSITGDDVSINGTVAGKLWDVIDKNLNQDTTFTFSPGVFGMGGFWDLSGPGGPGTSIVAKTSTSVFDLGTIPSSTGGTFWGFTIDEALTDIYFIEGPQYALGVETYTLDNMVMAVPEPGSLALLGAGLLGLGFCRRKRTSRA